MRDVGPAGHGEEESVDERGFEEPTWADLLQAVGQGAAHPTGDQRATLLAYWDRVPDVAYAKRCVIAHYLADLHSDPLDALRWNLAALDAYSGVRRDDLASIGIDDATSFEPSLHLNVGNDYFMLERFAEAAHHAQAAMSAQDQPATSPLAAMISRGAIRLRERAEQALQRRRELTGE